MRLGDAITSDPPKHPTSPLGLVWTAQSMHRTPVCINPVTNLAGPYLWPVHALGGPVLNAPGGNGLALGGCAFACSCWLRHLRKGAAAAGVATATGNTPTHLLSVCVNGEHEHEHEHAVSSQRCTALCVCSTRPKHAPRTRTYTQVTRPLAYTM